MRKGKIGVGIRQRIIKALGGYTSQFPDLAEKRSPVFVVDAKEIRKVADSYVVMHRDRMNYGELIVDRTARAEVLKALTKALDESGFVEFSREDMPGAAAYRMIGEIYVVDR